MDGFDELHQAQSVAEGLAIGVGELRVQQGMSDGFERGAYGKAQVVIARLGINMIATNFFVFFMPFFDQFLLLWGKALIAAADAQLDSATFLSRGRDGVENSGSNNVEEQNGARNRAQASADTNHAERVSKLWPSVLRLLRPVFHPDHELQA